jgi:hypothetical protein
MTRENLIAKYPKNYDKHMGHFDFIYTQITYQIMEDFSEWAHIGYISDDDQEVILFTQDIEF